MCKYSTKWHISDILRFTENYLANRAFGGKLVLLGGDFTQTLPIVPKGRREATVLATLKESQKSNWIKIPDHFLIENSNQVLEQLVDEIYPELSTKYEDSSYLKEPAILAQKNIDVDNLNLTKLSMLPGMEKIQRIPNPAEYLYLLDFFGFPCHCLQLKEGASIILLRNVNQSQGLCNGIQLVVVRIGDKVLKQKY
ncbi:hypothetical protein M9H77_16846 [Catharanthus roseus]|uniref:Uncharacterized protein n=1 Tax=Catharanthus roseus TaxID=4058 RepID=A0ACC0B2X5_CATRO|nr:hypothetical protein M9H77_16846 [Catharanthus roseus]